MQNPLSSDLKTLRQTALNALARREHSRWEMRQKLQQKINNSDAIAAVLNKLIQEKLLDDARFAEAYCRMRINRGYGPVRIQLELRDRGIADDLINDTLYSDAINWEKLAIQARQKRFGKNIPQNLSDRAKQMRFLQYRGFTHDQIKSAFIKHSEIVE